MKFFAKVFRCLCKLDKEGDDDGVSVPISMLTKGPEGLPDTLAEAAPQLIVSKLEVSIEKKNPHIEFEDKPTMSNSRESEMTSSTTKKSRSSIGSIPDTDQKTQNKLGDVWEETEEDEEKPDNEVYGKKLLEKHRISKKDVMGVFT